MRKNFAYIVLHISDSSALLYSPENMEEKFIYKKDIKVGEWYEINEKLKTIKKCIPLCETRIQSNRLEVKTALTFFNDKKYYNVVGFSPGFGPVGCFTYHSFKKERFYNAWITYMEYNQNIEFQKIMALFEVSWIVSNESFDFLSRTEMYHESFLSLKSYKIIKGIIIFCDQNKYEIFNEEYKICQFNLNLNEKKLCVGTFVKFVPIRDFSHNYVAVNVFDIGFTKGIDVVSFDFENKIIKLSVNNWEINSKNGLISVPGLCSLVSTENKKLPAAGQSLIIEFNRGFRTFVVSTEN